MKEQCLEELIDHLKVNLGRQMTNLRHFEMRAEEHQLNGGFLDSRARPESLEHRRKVVAKWQCWIDAVQRLNHDGESR